MKNLMFWVAALAMVFFTSCQQEQTTVVENATVDFTISTPAISTRAAEQAVFGNGAAVNVLEYALFEAELDANNNVVSLIGTPQTGVKSDAFAEEGEAVQTETALVDIPAIKGKSYAILFWAEADGDPYTVDWATQTVTINDAALKANNENLDAFFGVHTFTMTETAQQETAYLKRPFAQLNIATTDKSDAADAKVTVTETYVAVEAPKSLNILTGRTTTAETVVFDSAAIPTDKYVDLDKDGKYDLISFNYIFVDTEKSLTDVTFKYKYSEGSDTMEYVFDKITLERNHRTYIVGSLLTEEVIFNVKINPDWEDSHIFHGNGTGSTPPEPVDVPEPTNITTMDGDGRVSVSWEAEEGLTTNVTIGENTVQVMASRAAASKNQIFNELAEGDHKITLVNVDAEGNESDPVEVTAHAYGANYKASLTTRNMSNLAYVGSTKVATPTFGAWDKGMYTAITYTGASDAILVQNSATTATLSNVALGQELTYYTVYKPDNCMDSFDGPKKTEIARSIVPINVMQFNVQNDSYNWDSVLGRRADAVVARIKDNDIHIAGLQELYGGDAYTTLMNKLGANYAGVTYGRTMGTDREALALVWRKDKFTLKTHGRFWYNATDKDTAGYTTAAGITGKFERFCVWAILTENTSGIEYFVATTHLASSDEDKEVTSWEQFPLKWYQARWFAANCNGFAKYEGTNILRTMIFTGDFNCNQNTAPITGGLMGAGSYADTWDLATTKTSPGTGAGYERSTMNNSSGQQQQYVNFDYIFTSKPIDNSSDSYKVEVLSHTIHPAKYNSTRISDHNAVSVQLKYTYPEPK